MKSGWMGLAVGLVLTLSGCATAPNLDSYRPKDQDETLVVLTLRKIPSGINGKSLDLLMQPYAEDVYVGNFQKYLGVAGPGAQLTIRSRSDLRLVYVQLFRSARDVSMDVKDFRLILAGDHATAQARTELLFKFEGGRKEARQEIFRNEVTWRLRRTPAGWKIVEEIWQ